jgi:predicted PolB exonuclease-like 3'-5' exonuclease
MFKTIQNEVWAFDCEWVPDPAAAKLLLETDPEATDLEAMEALWENGGATAEDPRPYLRTVQCRIVSIAAVHRLGRGDDAKLNLIWMPRDPADPAQNAEAALIDRFLQAVGRRQPQLVGYNSRNADLKILLQRAFVNGVSAPGFCRRPDKPWEGCDYVARDNEWHVDLMDILGGFGARGAVSLHEAATLSGIPGKIDARGDDIARMWLDGRWRDIVQYNCFDALTTYLVWLRLAHLGGFFDAARYEIEQDRVHEMLETLCEAPETRFLERYVEEWDRLQVLKDEL